MEFFDRFKKKEPRALSAPPAAKPQPLGPALVEIARIITNGDDAVLRDAAACAEDPRGWFEAHQERYEERCIDSPDDLDLVLWLGLADLLEEHGWVCERDWKDELEDFLYFLGHLKGAQSLGLPMEPAWFREDGDIPLWCGILADKWSAQGIQVAAIDIDSDSYVLFPATAGQLSQLRQLADAVGHRIDGIE